MAFSSCSRSLLFAAEAAAASAKGRTPDHTKKHMGFSGTVDGRNPASPNGWLKPYKQWDLNHLSTGAGFRQPSTVSNRVSNVFFKLFLEVIKHG
jgi:hypothetical protein